MKINFLLLIVISASNLFKPGTYEHKRNGKTYSLQIKSDSTFIYERPAIFSGKIRESGIWRIRSDSLMLIDSIGTIHSKSSLTASKLPDQDYLSIKVTNEIDEPLKDIGVSLNDDKVLKRTNENGIARFEFSELKKRRINQPDSTIEVVTLRAEKWTQSSAVKNIFCNNVIIVKDFHPITTFELRERRLKIVGDKLIFPNPSGMNEDQTFEFERTR